MREMLSRGDPEVYCRYIMYKIYHHMLLIHEISLLSFSCEFIANEWGDWALYSATIYDLHTNRTEVHSLPKREDIILPTDKLIEKMKEEQLLYVEKFAADDSEANRLREERERKENTEFVRRLDVIVLQNKTSDPKSGQSSNLRAGKVLRNQQYRKFWSVLPPPPPKEDRNHKFEIYEELREDFKKQIQPLKKEIDHSEDATFQKQLVEQTDKAFMEVNPAFNKKLSELVTSENYQFKKEFSEFQEIKKDYLKRQMEGKLPVVQEKTYSQEMVSNRRSRVEVSSSDRTNLSKILATNRSSEGEGEGGYSQMQSLSKSTGRAEHRSILSHTVRQRQTPGVGDHLFKLDTSGSAKLPVKSAGQPQSTRTIGKSGETESRDLPYLQLSDRKERLELRFRTADTIDLPTADISLAKEERWGSGGTSSRKGLRTEHTAESERRTEGGKGWMFPELVSTTGTETAGSAGHNGSLLQSLKVAKSPVRESTRVWAERHETDMLRRRHLNIRIKERSTRRVAGGGVGWGKVMVQELVGRPACPAEIVQKYKEMVDSQLDPGVWSWSPGAREMKTLESRLRAQRGVGSPVRGQGGWQGQGGLEERHSAKLLGFQGDLRLMLRQQSGAKGKAHPTHYEDKPSLSETGNAKSPLATARKQGQYVQFDL